MIRQGWLLTVIWGLMACQPKGALLYQYPKANEYPIDQVVLVIDYLNLKDDVGKFWDFDSYYHQQVLNQLLLNINHHLQSKGYPPVETYLLSSGLLIKSNFSVEHYIKDEPQNELLYPPYILAKSHINENQLITHQEILGTLVKYIAPRRHHESDEYLHRGMQFGYQLDALNVSENTAVLYVHINLSAPGIIKQIGTFLLSGAIASQSDYAHVHLAATTQKHVSAFLLHEKNGQILWKNHNQNWTPEQPIKLLLDGLQAINEKIDSR